MKSYKQLSEELGVPVNTLKGWVQNILGIYADKSYANRYTNKAVSFDKIVVNKIWYIRFMKQLDYKESTIKAILNDPNFDSEKLLEETIVSLERKRDELDKIIQTATNMKNTGVNIVQFGIDLGLNLDQNYTDFLQTLNKFFACTTNVSNEDLLNEDMFEIFFSSFVKLIANLVASYVCNKKEEPTEVFKMLEIFVEENATVLGDSRCFILSFFVFMLNIGTIRKSLSIKYGDKCVEYVFNVVVKYLETTEPTGLDKKIEMFDDLFEHEKFDNTLESVLKKCLKYDEPLLQNILKFYYEFCYGMSLFTEKGKAVIFKSLFRFNENVLINEWDNYQRYKYEIYMKFLKQMEGEK